MSETEINKIGEQPHSVKISINAKGQFSAEVKCYGSTPQEAMQKSCKFAAELENMIQLKNGGN